MQHTLLADGEVDQLPRFARSLGNRLLHEHVRPGAEKVTRNRKMSRSRRHHADRIQRAKQLAVIPNGPRADLGGDLIPGLLAGVNDGNELAAGDLRILLRMEAPEVADSDHRRSDFFHDGAIMPALGHRPRVNLPLKEIPLCSNRWHAPAARSPPSPARAAS